MTMVTVIVTVSVMIMVKFSKVISSGAKVTRLKVYRCVPNNH